MPRSCLALAMLASCSTPSPSPSPTPTPTPSAETRGPSPSAETPSPTPTPEVRGPSPAPTTAPTPDPPPPVNVPVPGFSSDLLIALRAPSPPALDGRLDDEAWVGAAPIPIVTDWRGAPTTLPTSARFAWDDDALYFAFECGYDELVVDEAAPTSRELPTLYEKDAVEVFLDPDPSTPATYVEIEVGPRGHFLDVDVDRARRPRGDVAWASGMTIATRVDETARRFVVEARVPARALGRGRLAPGTMRVGLYRLAGRSPARQYLARFPTMTERPSFHVPERFGSLALSERATAGE